MMHQAGAGKFELQPTVQYVNLVDTNNSNTVFTKFTISGMIESLKAEYGINDNFSAGLVLTNYALTITSSNTGILPAFKENGLLDPQLFLNTRWDDIGGGILRVGTKLAISMGNHTSDSSFNENGASGGTTLLPYVGWEKNVGPGLIGTRLSFMVDLTNKKWSDDANKFDPASSTGYATGGDTTKLDAFYEYHLSPGNNLGLDLWYQDTTSNKEVSNGVTTSDDNGSAGLGGAVYGQWLASASQNLVIVVVPVVAMGSTAPSVPMVEGTSHVKSTDVFTAMVNVNFIF
jgi:hypothetical protein